MTNANRHTAEEFATWAIPQMDHVYTASLYLTRNDQEAADLLQETFLRAFRCWRQFAPGTNCRAWLLKILHDIFNDRYRERHVEYDESTDDPERDDAADIDAEGAMLSPVLDDEVDRALRRLPIELREATVLVDLQDLTHEEAAAACGCPIGMLRSRLSRARRQLQEMLRRDAKETGSGYRYAVR